MKAQLQRLFRLNNGRSVLARQDEHGDVHPITYANLTQAQNRRLKMASSKDWEIIGHRPYYLAIIPPLPVPTEAGWNMAAMHKADDERSNGPRR